MPSRDAADDGIPQLVKPRALQTGMTVGVVCPASPPKSDEGWVLAEAQLAELGLEVRWSPLCEALRAGKEHGDHALRAAELAWGFGEKTVDLVWCVRGGYGCLPLLPFMDWTAIQRNPKLFLGFSDITALSLAMHIRTGLVTLHAPMPAQVLTPYARGEVRRIVGSAGPAGAASPLDAEERAGVLPDVPVTITPGAASGRLLPGNLALLTRLLGTPFEPNFRGRILCIEDVGEAPYRVHGMLTQLLLSGRLSEVAGIALGSFTEVEGEASADESAEYRTVFQDRLTELGVPIFWGLPMGHIRSQTLLPVGVEASIDADVGVLEILEGAVV